MKMSFIYIRIISYKIISISKADSRPAMMMMMMIIIKGKKVKIGLRSHCNEKSFPYQRVST